MVAEIDEILAEPPALVEGKYENTRKVIDRLFGLDRVKRTLEK